MHVLGHDAFGRPWYWWVPAAWAQHQPLLVPYCNSSIARSLTQQTVPRCSISPRVLEYPAFADSFAKALADAEAGDAPSKRDSGTASKAAALRKVKAKL